MAMRTCACPTCFNTSRPGMAGLGSTPLSWIPLPKPSFLRDEWIDALGINECDVNENSRVCSAHFKPKEVIRSHNKVKADVVPTLHLSKKGDSFLGNEDSDFELSDDDIKVVEEKKKEEKKKTESEPPLLQTPEGRPSRRAARMAAEKIQKTVQKYCMEEEEESPPHRPDIKFNVDDVKPTTSGYNYGNSQRKTTPTIIAPKQSQLASIHATQMANQAIRKCLPIGTTITLQSPGAKPQIMTNKLPIPQNTKIAIPPARIMIPPAKTQTITYSMKQNQPLQTKAGATIIYKPIRGPAIQLPKPPVIIEAPKPIPLKDRTDIMNLQMDCIDSPLSPAQVKAYQNAVKLNEEFDKKLLSYKNGKDTRIIYCTTSEVPPVNTSPIVTNASASLQQMSRNLNGVPKPQTMNQVRAPIMSQVRAPIQLQPGMVLAQTAQGMQLLRGMMPSQTLVLGNTTNTLTSSANNHPLSYKVLVDSRTGLVVGTIPNDSALLQPNKNIALNPTQNISLPITKTSQSSGLQITSVTGATTLPQVDVFNKVINGGNKTVVAQSLLSIRVLPIEENTKKARNLQITQLGQQLDRDKFLSAPIIWLAKVGLIDREIKCLCMKEKMELSPCKLSVDGYLWRCKRAPRCPRTVQIPRISFFARFGAQLYKLHRLIFHWSIQSDILHVIHDTVVDIYMVRSVWRAVQEVCGKALETKAQKLGGPISKVEVATVKMGWHIIVGAYDRTTRQTRMKVVTDAKNQPLGLSQVIQKLMDLWLAPHTVVITTDYKLSTMSRNTLTYKYIDPTKTFNPDMTVRTSVENLENQLSRMFGSFSMSQLKPETIQGFLDEYQWRTRFGQSPRMAFWNIISDIASQSGRKLIVPTDVVLQTSSSSSSSDDSVSDNKGSVQIENILKHPGSWSQQPKKPQQSGQQVAKPAPVEPPKLVDLNNYFYARKNPESSLLLPDPNLNNYHFKCLVCRKVLDNNIKVMKHLMAHLEQTRQRNPDLSDLTQCKYCFRDFDTPYSMQCHMENVHLSTNDLACKICNHALASKSSLINHMKHHHVQSEIPYGCQACNYRSSFHREVIDHFQQVHNGSNKLLCHYCLKTYNVKFSQPEAVGMIQNYYYHLYKHQIKSANKKCSSCCLVFVNIHELKAHRQKDHISMAKKKDVIPLPINANNPILVPDPTRKPSPRSINKSPNSGVKKSIKLTPPVLEPYVAQPIILKKDPPLNQEPPVMVDNLGSCHMCAECSHQIERTHYAKKMICGKCHYSTYCGKAFVDHMIAQHSNVTKTKKEMNFISEPLKLDNSLFCICGFSSTDGNSIANHLKQCGYKTAYPSTVAALAATVKKEPEDSPCETGSAFFPPLVVLDENEEEFVNNTLSKIPEPETLEIENPIKRRRIDLEPGSTELNEESAKKASETEKPSMLNALGLVRRRSTHSEDEDEDEDCPPLLTREEIDPKKGPARNTRSSRTSSLTKNPDSEYADIDKIMDELEAFTEEAPTLPME